MVSNSSNTHEINNKKQIINNSMDSNVIDKYGLCFPGKYYIVIIFHYEYLYI